MSKFKITALLISICMLTTLSLTACNSEEKYGTRPMDGLPQSTRMDRNEIARLSQATLLAGTGAATQVVDEDTTFFIDEDGTIVFYAWTMGNPAHPLGQGLVRFAQEIETRSNGELRVEVKLDAAGDVDIINRVNANKVDVALISIWSAWSGINDKANLEALPFMFNTYEEAWAAYEGDLGDWVARNIIEPEGSVSLSYMSNGQRHFTNNVRPITVPEDVAGLRMRSPQTTTHLAMYDVLGAAAISLPFGQVYAGLAAGDFDGQDNPMGFIYSGKLYEVQEYLSLSNHIFSCAPLVASGDFWDSLSSEHKQVVRESAIIAARYQNDLTKRMDEEWIREIGASGVAVNNINTPLFVEAMESIWEEHMAIYGNEIATIVSRYVNDPNALAHKFAN